MDEHTDLVTIGGSILDNIEDGDNIKIDDICDTDVDTDCDPINYVEGMHMGVISKDGILKVCAELMNDDRYELEDELERAMAILSSPILEFNLGQKLNPLD